MPEGFGAGQLSQFSNLVWNMLGNVAGGLMDTFWLGDINRQKNFEYSKKLIDYQNEYNSPTSQMQRLSAAGLNPNLVYGSSAPSGVSGNASAPANTSTARYNSADLSLAMLQANQMKSLETERELWVSQAEKNRAEARYTNQMADRYNELIDVQIREANSRINEAASRMDLNSSSIQLQSAQKSLALAEEAYRRGEIGLQEFRRQEIIAQIDLFRSSASLNNQNVIKSHYDSQLLMLETNYKRLFYVGNRMQQLSSAEFAARKQEFENYAARLASQFGIDDSKVARWTEWIFNRIGSILSGAVAGSAGAALKTAAVAP